MGPGAGFGEWKRAQDKPFYSESLSALRSLGASFVRYQGWHNRPDLTVAALENGESGFTWDFSKIDPPLLDFLAVMGDRPFILNFSAVPRSAQSAQDMAEYFGRFAAWYTQGQFEDQIGRKHVSGHSIALPYWEVLNEPDFEPPLSPANYTAAYDAIVAAVKKNSPRTQFIGLALASTDSDPAFTTYFLDSRNHAAGIPIDYISYHFYALYRASAAQSVPTARVFDQADEFVESIRYICAIRDVLSPGTGLMITEVGTMNLGARARPANLLRLEIQLSAALYAYLYCRLAALGVKAIHVSGLVSVQPDQIWQELAMLEWASGRPNARYWVLKFLNEHFPPGSTLVQTRNFTTPPYPLPRVALEMMSREVPVFGQAFVTPQGARRLLLVNRTTEAVTVSLGGESPSSWLVVGQQESHREPQVSQGGKSFGMAPLGVALGMFDQV
jgi:glycosyl hydrolase family 39 (putative alpha-L-iduronidase)